MTPTKGGDIRTCLSHLVSVPAPPLRPTELSRLRTSCGFLSIQQTFPEHPRPVPQPVGDGDLANRGREGTQSTSRSRLHSRGRSWPEVRDRAGGRSAVGAQREPARLCSHALAWSSPRGPFCSPPPWPCHAGFSAEGHGPLRPPGGSGPWPQFDGRPVGSQLRRLRWLAAPSPHPSMWPHGEWVPPSS